MNYERKNKSLSLSTNPKGIEDGGQRHSETMVHLPPPHIHQHHVFESYQFQPQIQQQSSPPQNYTLRHPTQQYVVNEPLSVTEPLSMSTTTDRFGRFVSEHEINFAKNEVCVPSTCICFFFALLFSLMAIMSGVYFGCKFLRL